jgi:uncharacterized protein
MMNTEVASRGMGNHAISSERTLIKRKSLLKTILAQFECHPQGLHGTPHWARVRLHALAIGRETGADLLVVELFAFIHDSRRQDEYRDPDHGKRASIYAEQLRGSFFELEDSAFILLQEALEGHSHGGVHSNPTIQTCWDADRLDLVRLHIDPDPSLLSPEASSHIDRAWDLLYAKRR